MNTRDLALIGALAKSGRRPRREREPRYRLQRLATVLGDRIGWTAWGFGVVLLLWFDAPALLVLMWVLMLGVLLWVPPVRLALRRWRLRRVQARSWTGTPWGVPSMAQGLGLTTPGGQIPHLAQYRFADSGRRRDLTFVLPPGLTVDDFASKRSAIVDAFGATRGKVGPAGPGRVKLLLFAVDPFGETSDVDWAKPDEPRADDVQAAHVDPAADAAPWWDEPSPTPETGTDDGSDRDD
ncbi:hypothetical protein [Gordonia sp. QH-12]|uniref:hypothetical protein n=1 Tax=Gordonia sp. QH-12 TaxID=1437876 RepID=UPI0018D3BDCB|nr:hypothetical protein [Gordonia sp. QH-12]